MDLDRIDLLASPDEPAEPDLHPDVEESLGPEGRCDYYAYCRGCERRYKLLYAPEEFNPDTNYCGGSPWCLP